MVAGAGKADAAAAAIGGAQPVSVPAAGAIGLETTLWLLDDEAAAKLPDKARSD
jgi:6-phosphogluconolactonase